VNNRELGINFYTVHLVYLPQDYLGWHNVDGGLLYLVDSDGMGNTDLMAYYDY
jgi:hypothetical protein